MDASTVPNVAPGLDLVVLHDATVARKAEEAMLQLQKLESLGVLAAGVAHDFNNLLTTVIGNVALARSAVTPGLDAAESLDQASLAATRAADLSLQMLVFAGLAPAVREVVDINDLIRDMETLLVASVAPLVSVEYDLGDDSLPVRVDPVQLRQVVLNIVVNGSEAMVGNEGTVRISTGAMDVDEAYLREMFLAPELLPGRYVWVEIADSGIGMDDATRALVFDPFFTTKFVGRGLGLPTALGTLRSHGGAIRIDSRSAVGTTVRFLLPVYRDGPEDGPGAGGAA